ncbi:cytochrome c [Chelativorans sp. AA-79]|uniref:cytochrome c n=1 Tax=Chelativorans sp. AA-79 TaxID=3028735 RepID=UPI0023FA2EF5|nr:cytochrome c [Chelativorans sp. AA-79]WEX09700.1 cytochrome c [Chelativorans sp. AA-79]
MKILYGVVVAVLVLVAAAVAYAVSPRALETVERPDSEGLDQETVARGEELAMIGNCADCHTAEGGEPYAGGRAIPTPLGTLYGTNITPDEETGIGAWSAEAFQRAMYRGLDREGNHLYPAFPYHHFTKAAEEDIEAIYTYLMSLEPVRNEAPAHELTFPFNIRPLLAGWKLLYLENERFAGLPDTDEQVNRGAYLVQGLAHCGGCHTPRNALQAEIEDEFLQGEVTENWYAPAIAGEVPAATSWDKEQLNTYLTGQWTERHGVAVGPMAPVAHNLSRVPGEDVAAISAYMATLIESDTGAEAEAEEITAAVGEEPAGDNPGAVIYASACAGCHEGEPARFAAGLQLAYSTSLRIPDPRNLIHIIEQGVQPPEGRPGPYMPGFEGALTQEQMVALTSYLRERFTDLDPWEDLEGAATEIMGSGAAHTAEASHTEE